MAKKNERQLERRAVAEQLRKQQARKERTRSMVIIGGAVVIVIGLLTAALVPYIQDQRNQGKIDSTPLSKLGVTTSAAKCSAVQKKQAEGGSQHLDAGTKIPYPDSPPSFGQHWGNFLQGSEIRPFYTVQDRPEIERLVHSLEHGHTILWYDDTLKPGTKAYKDIQAMADKLGDSAYFMAAPWTSADGGPFPSGMHVALTHWTGPQDQQGITEYCAAPSGAVVQSFMDEYPAGNAPEAGAP